MAMDRRTFLRISSLGATGLALGAGGLVLTGCDPEPLLEPGPRPGTT